MSAAEFADWAAFFDIEPMPQTRADIRSAQIVQAILYTGTRVKKPLKEIMADWWGDYSQQTPEQIKRAMRTIAAAMPGKFKVVTNDT